MAYTLPVSVSMPSWMSKQMLIGAAGCTGGLIFGDFAAARVLSLTGMTGTTALVVSAGTKVALGVAAFYGASKLKGGAQVGVGLASIGCFASALTDVVARYWPAVRSAKARIGAATLGTRAYAAAPGTVTLRVAPGMTYGAPAGIPIRAETPSGIALGGF